MTTTAPALYANILNADGTRRGRGLIQVISLRATELLDGSGQISARLLANDERTQKLVTPEARVQFRARLPNGRYTTLAIMIVKSISYSTNDNGTSMEVSGQDLLNELSDDTPGPNVVFEARTVQQIVTDLCASAGWSVRGSVGDTLMSIRISGASTLRAIRDVCASQGVHFRLTDTYRELELYRSATLTNANSVLTATSQMPTIDPAIYKRFDLALIESITQSSTSAELWNEIIPLGGGEGAAAISLKEAYDASTRGGIIRTVGADGKFVYSVANAASQGLYGRKRKVIAYKLSTPTAQTTAGVLAASELLYDSAVADLGRMAVRRTDYKLTCVNVLRKLRIGDVIRIQHATPLLNEQGAQVSLVGVDAPFHITRIEHSYDPSGHRVSLQVSNVDSEPQSVATQLAEIKEDVQLSQLSLKPYPYREIYTVKEPVQWLDSAPTYCFSARLLLDIDDTLLSVQSFTLTIRSFPMYSWTVVTGVSLPVQNQYTVQSNTLHPNNLQLLVNNVNITTEVGGPWNPAPANNPVDVKINLTQYLLNASGGFRQRHIIEVRPTELAKNIGVPGYGGPGPSATFGNQGFVELLGVLAATSQAIIRG